MIPFLFSDADNTLWDTDAVYRGAHLWLFREVAKQLDLRPEIEDEHAVGLVRELDQKLAHSHPAHLGYPPLMLVRELWARLAPVGRGSCNESLAVEIEAEFTRRTGELPVLREGVAKGLRCLHTLGYPVHVMTEGRIERCVGRLHHYSLSDYVQSVERVTKDNAHFSMLRSKLPSGTIGWVVGDLLTRDILPARAAGFRTIYFPGSFRPRWEQSLTVDPDIIQINTFAAIPKILENANA